MKRTAAAIVLLAGVACAASASVPQDHVVIYRCTDASGGVTLQNDVPCPPGAQEQRQTVDVPPPLPAYTARETRMPAVVAAEAKAESATIEQALPVPVPAAEREPPPALYDCSTWDEVHYLTDVETPQQRCAPLQVVGIGGAPLPGAATACEQVADTCTAVPEEALCRSWQRRIDEAEFRWKFARGADDTDRRLEYETLAATYRNSTCNL